MRKRLCWSYTRATRAAALPATTPAASFSMSGRGMWVEKLRWKASYSPRCTSSTMRATEASLGCTK